MTVIGRMDFPALARKQRQEDRRGIDHVGGVERGAGAQLVLIERGEAGAGWSERGGELSGQGRDRFIGIAAEDGSGNVVIIEFTRPHVRHERIGHEAERWHFMGLAGLEAKRSDTLPQVGKRGSGPGAFGGRAGHRGAAVAASGQQERGGE